MNFYRLFFEGGVAAQLPHSWEGVKKSADAQFLLPYRNTPFKLNHFGLAYDEHPIKLDTLKVLKFTRVKTEKKYAHQIKSIIFLSYKKNHFLSMCYKGKGGLWRSHPRNVPDGFSFYGDFLSGVFGEGSEEEEEKEEEEKDAFVKWDFFGLLRDFLFETRRPPVSRKKRELEKKCIFIHFRERSKQLPPRF